MCFFLSQLCVGAEELYDGTLMLPYLVACLVILLITLVTDLYTFYHINYYKQSSEQFSTHHAEYYSLKDICKICHTHCNDESIVAQKVDIPLKSTATSCILLVFSCLILICLNSTNDNSYSISILLIFFLLFFTTVNIPMIVCLSTMNNFANLAAARQRNNKLAWNRTRNQQWEIKCALEDRIQNIL